MRTEQKQGLVMPHKCPTCDVVIGSIWEFFNKLSQAEYLISGMCQSCQDEMFDER